MASLGMRTTEHFNDVTRFDKRSSGASRSSRVWEYRTFYAAGSGGFEPRDDEDHGGKEKGGGHRGRKGGKEKGGKGEGGKDKGGKDKGGKDKGREGKRGFEPRR